MLSLHLLIKITKMGDCIRLLPVVIRADLIEAGDHVGWNDLMYAATAVACGQAIDVPEIILYDIDLLSTSTSEIGEIGDHAARMLTPGAAKSGYNNPKWW